VLPGADSFAQTRRKVASNPPGSPSKSAQEIEKTKADLIKAAEDYKASLEKLLGFQERAVASASEKAEQRRALLAQGIVSKREVEDSEREVANAQAKVNETRKQMGEADDLVAEAQVVGRAARMPIGSYQSTAALIRYYGPAHWVLADASKVEAFFAGRFHHSLPISAMGQTPVHDRLGFDHHNSMDVAVQPDGVEGQALMEYLRSQGIPFIAFRHAVAGSATGAHIHVGYPSHRLAR